MTQMNILSIRVVSHPALSDLLDFPTEDAMYTTLLGEGALKMVLCLASKEPPAINHLVQGEAFCRCTARF